MKKRIITITIIAVLLLLLLFVAVFSAFTAWMIWGNLTISVSEYRIESEKLPEAFDLGELFAIF